MYKKILLATCIVLFFASSCGSFYVSPDQISTLPTLIQTITPITTSTLFEIPTLTTTPTPTKTPTIFVTKPLSAEATYTTFPVESTPFNSSLPIIPNAQNVEKADWITSVFGKRGDTISYQVDVSLEDIRLFYLEELQKEGWTWVYTDYGESLVTTVPGSALFMEFRKDNLRLGIGSIGFGFFGESIPVFAGTGYSGATLVFYYIGMIAGGLDLLGPSKESIKQDAMLFSSEFVEFKHPSNWHLTESLLQTINSDDAIIYFSDAGMCKVTQQPCFVNFTNLFGSYFDIPISIRVHPELSTLTLEEADAVRWEELKNIIPNQTYQFPENFMNPSSLESIEIRSILLGDGTPALQRVYKWNAEGIEESSIQGTFISTYTLFMSADTLIEFHTDFTSEEWESEKSTINHIISGIIKVK